MPSLPSGRICPNLMIMSEKLYLVGGIGEDNFIYVFDLKKGSYWQTCKGNLPKLASMGCVEFDGEFIVFGGVNADDQMHAEVYQVRIDNDQGTYEATLLFNQLQLPDRFIHNQIMFDLEHPSRFKIMGRKALHTCQID